MDVMKQNRINLMRELLSCGTNVPIWHYDGDGHLLDTTAEHLVLDKIFSYIGASDYMLQYGKNHTAPLILGSDMGLQWCAVFERTGNSVYLLGPVFHSEISGSYIIESIDRYHIDPTFQKQYIRLLHEIPVVPNVVFLQYALMMHYCVTGEYLNRSDIQFQPRSGIISPRTGNSEQEDNRYQTRQLLLHMLREGNMNYKQTLADSNHLFGSFIGTNRDSLIHATIGATGFTALCIHEAIAAGISSDTAYAVGDAYNESMIQCRNIEELTAIAQEMYEDFVFRCHKHRMNPNLSPQIQSCQEYIELYAEKPLYLATLAKRVGYSEYYLSRKFKKETGMSISNYIKYVRVERSKLMLAGAGVTIAQIADTLHFASSSHFAESFKKITGMTPQQYRTENQQL